MIRLFESLEKLGPSFLEFRAFVWVWKGLEFRIRGSAVWKFSVPLPENCFNLISALAAPFLLFQSLCTHSTNHMQQSDSCSFQVPSLVQKFLFGLWLLQQEQVVHVPKVMQHERAHHFHVEARRLELLVFVVVVSILPLRRRLL